MSIQRFGVSHIVHGMLIDGMAPCIEKYELIYLFSGS
jgi:hypothetical protein